MSQLWMLHKLTESYAVSLACDHGAASWVLVLTRDGTDYVYTGSIDSVVQRAYNGDRADGHNPADN